MSSDCERNSLNVHITRRLVEIREGCHIRNDREYVRRRILNMGSQCFVNLVRLDRNVHVHLLE